MVGRYVCTLVLPLFVAILGCQNYYIDLTPDGGDADVGETNPLVSPPLCGNGALDPGEECDDGNRLDDDSCTWSCREGPGSGPGPVDPAARRLVPAGDPVVLPAPAQPPLAPGVGGGQALMPFVSSGELHVGSWPRSPFGADATSSLTTRFLHADGSLARDDVVLSLMSGWTVWSLTNVARGSDVLLLWRAGSDGILGARMSADLGLLDAPALVVIASEADLPAAAATGDGYVVAWHEGPAGNPCVHDNTEPNHINLGRLGPDGLADGMPEPVVLEDQDGAWTAPHLAAGDDSSVGLLWWRASREASGGCTLRLGIADADLATVRDGGTVAPGWAGRIVFGGGAYRVAWLNVNGVQPQMGFVALDRNAVLLDAPVVHDLAVEMFVGEFELAAGENELVAVVGGYTAAAGQHLLFVVTDLLGRMVASAASVDPTCESATTRCYPGPFNIVRSGDEFLVFYFATVNPFDPRPTTEMRMVRLVPGS